MVAMPVEGGKGLNGFRLNDFHLKLSRIVLLNCYSAPTKIK